MGRLKLSLDLKHDMWTYFVLYLVKWKCWNVPFCENEILAYMLLSLRNKKVELVLWFKTCYVNIFCFVFGKMNVLECSLSRNRDLAYMVNFINGKVECVPWFKTWFVILFGFVFGKMKVLKCPLSRKWDFGQYAYKFEKYEG